MMNSEALDFVKSKGTSTNLGLSSDDLIEILMELTIRLRKTFFIVILITFMVAFLPASLFSGGITHENYTPLIYLLVSTVIDHSVNSMLHNQEVQIIVSSPLSVISVCIELAIMISILINLPILIYEFYTFVEPGLYSHEKKLLKEAIGMLVFLFFLGATIAYFIVLPITLRVLTSTTIPLLDFGSTPMLALFSLDSIFSMIFWTVVSTGFLYTLPEILYILVMFEVIDVEYLEEKKNNVILAILILAAIITPDPTFVSMIVLSLPLIVVYQLIIQKGYKVRGKRYFKYVRRLPYGN